MNKAIAEPLIFRGKNAVAQAHAHLAKMLETQPELAGQLCVITTPITKEEKPVRMAPSLTPEEAAERRQRAQAKLAQAKLAEALPFQLQVRRGLGAKWHDLGRFSTREEAEAARELLQETQAGSAFQIVDP